MVGATLDRNGLRPSRYYITDDDTLILASEVGVLELPSEKIFKKSRLEPGKMLVVDTVQGIVLTDEEVKNKYASRYPYGEWLDQNVVELSALKAVSYTHLDVYKRQLLCFISLSPATHLIEKDCKNVPSLL